MSELNATRNSRPGENKIYADPSSFAEVLTIAPPIVEQLRLHFDLPSPSGEGSGPRSGRLESSGGSRQSHSRLSSELKQQRSLVEHQAERICQLEQALDQSQSSLKELQLQLVGQQFLENQLAATESIANIQQRAIVQLQHQLEQRQQQLEAQRAEIGDRDRMLTELLTTMKQLANTQQLELDRLKNQIAHNLANARINQSQLQQQLLHCQQTINHQQRQLQGLDLNPDQANPIYAEGGLVGEAVELAVCTSAQQTLEFQTALEQLETDLQIAQIALQEQQRVIEHFQQYRTGVMAELADRPIEVNRPTEAERAMGAEQPTDVKTAHFRIEELQTHCDQQQIRITELEQQTAEMQEQILRQAKQASEYETAVQHWKDRFFARRDQILTLKDRLEQTFAGSPDDLADLLALLQMATAEPPDLASPALIAAPSFNPGPKIEVPEFLIRRRSYKNRQA
jgi:chromosome segregation ATPase